MKWQRGYRSENVEDRRGQGGGVGGVGGLMNLLPLFGRLGGLGILALVILLFVAPRVCGSGGGSGGGGTGPAQPGAEQPAERADDSERELVEFVSFVFDDVQQTWQRELDRSGKRYRPAKLVLYTDATETGCGYGSAAVGPFYCPRDEKVYIDLDFYRALKQRFGAPGDFAQAYVIAHEVGHHVQHQLGLIEEGGAASNERSVETELQADCLAGVWARATERRKLLEGGDIEEALGAAAAIGDDTLQRKSGGRVNPDNFTHGSSAQRTRWFKRGFDDGRFEACDTRARTGR